MTPAMTLDAMLEHQGYTERAVGCMVPGGMDIDGVIGADIMHEREAVITYASRTLHLKS